MIANVADTAMMNQLVAGKPVQKDCVGTGKINLPVGGRSKRAILLVLKL
jgi:hypothetical protein